MKRVIIFAGLVILIIVCLVSLKQCPGEGLICSSTPIKRIFFGGYSKKELLDSYLYEVSKGDTIKKIKIKEVDFIEMDTLHTRFFYKIPGSILSNNKIIWVNNTIITISEIKIGNVHHNTQFSNKTICGIISYKVNNIQVFGHSIRIIK